MLAAGTIEAMAAGAVIGALSAPAIAGAGAYALVGAFAGFALSLVSLFTIPTTIHGIMKAGAALVKSALAARRESRARNVLEGLENA